jgi:hypothetical protein
MRDPGLWRPMRLGNGPEVIDTTPASGWQTPG